VDGFEEVVGGDGIMPGEVGEGAGDFEDAVVGAGREVHLVHGVFQEFARGFVEGGMGFHDAGRHGGVAADVWFAGETGRLHGAGGFDAGADGLGRFPGVGAVEVAELDGRDFDVDVDAVEERTGEALSIRSELVRGAPALTFGVAEVTTGIRMSAPQK
jgi:hypothetical protein